MPHKCVWLLKEMINLLVKFELKGSYWSVLCNGTRYPSCTCIISQFSFILKFSIHVLLYKHMCVCVCIIVI